MEARNLLPEDCEKLNETMEKIKETNPMAIHRFFEQNEGQAIDSFKVDIHHALRSIEGKVDTLSRKIDLIFGGTVLIDGKFTKIK